MILGQHSYSKKFDKPRIFFGWGRLAWTAAGLQEQQRLRHSKVAIFGGIQLFGGLLVEIGKGKGTAKGPPLWFLYLSLPQGVYGV